LDEELEKGAAEEAPALKGGGSEGVAPALKGEERKFYA
jgi:hypothetical protein